MPKASKPSTRKPAARSKKTAAPEPVLEQVPEITDNGKIEQPSDRVIKLDNLGRMSSKDAASLLRISDRTLRNWRKEGCMGATLVTQLEWDRDTPKLRKAGEQLGALFTFASVEPMLEGITIKGWCPDWVICGGESGPGARWMDHFWAHQLKDQVVAAGSAFFMKQMTNRKPIPESLMVRQLPGVLA